MDQRMRKLRDALVFAAAFWALAIYLGVTVHPGYIFNFGYIGTAIGIGSGLSAVLPRERKVVGRRVIQLLVGGYMLVVLGLYGGENMQLEGFFFNMFAGMMGGAVLHYLIAKIVGPFWFGRGWCSCACWTAGVLDLLPYTPQRRHHDAKARDDGAWRWGPYGLFAGSLVLAVTLFYGFGYQPDTHASALTWLLAGNAVYYAAGIGMAFVFKDNRAFCKYLCPVSVPLKVGTRFSLLKIGLRGDCNGCGACNQVCTMGCDPRSYVSRGERVASTECILCESCVNACPRQALALTNALGRKSASGGRGLLDRNRARRVA